MLEGINVKIRASRGGQLSKRVPERRQSGNPLGGFESVRTGLGGR